MMLFVSHAFDKKGRKVYQKFKELLLEELKSARDLGTLIEHVEVWDGAIPAGEPLRECLVQRLNASDVLVILVPSGPPPAGVDAESSESNTSPPAADGSLEHSSMHPLRPWLTSEYFRFSATQRRVIKVFPRDWKSPYAMQVYRDLLESDPVFIEVSKYSDKGLTDAAKQTVDGIVSYQHQLATEAGEPNELRRIVEEAAGNRLNAERRLLGGGWILFALLLLAIFWVWSNQYRHVGLSRLWAKQGEQPMNSILSILTFAHLPVLTFFIIAFARIHDDWANNAHLMGRKRYIDDLRVRLAALDSIRLMVWVACSLWLAYLVRATDTIIPTVFSEERHGLEGWLASVKSVDVGKIACCVEGRSSDVLVFVPPHPSFDWPAGFFFAAAGASLIMLYSRLALSRGYWSNGRVGITIIVIAITSSCMYNGAWLCGGEEPFPVGALPVDIVLFVGLALVASRLESTYLRIEPVFVLPIWGYAALQLVSTWSRVAPDGEFVRAAIVLTALCCKILLFLLLGHIAGTNRLIFYLDRIYAWTSAEQKAHLDWEESRRTRTAYLTTAYGEREKYGDTRRRGSDRGQSHSNGEPHGEARQPAEGVHERGEGLREGAAATSGRSSGTETVRGR